MTRCLAGLWLPLVLRLLYLFGPVSLEAGSVLPGQLDASHAEGDAVVLSVQMDDLKKVLPEKAESSPPPS